MISYISLSQSPTEFQIHDTPTEKNGEACSQSSDVVAYLDIAELTTMVNDMKKQLKKRVPTIKILTQYEKFFKRRMANVPAMVRACEARAEELEASVIDDECSQDWIFHQYVKPKKINKAVA